MPSDARPGLYLIAPPTLDAAAQDALGAVLDAHPADCLRLDLITQDTAALAREAGAARDLAASRAVPVVIADHADLVEPLGLDGLHLSDPRGLRALRARWGDGPILGASCGASRHDGMNAGEAGADYVAFGPAGGSGTGLRAAPDLFAWWAEMIELPVVAEGALDEAAIAALAPHVDFLAIGPEIWGADDPAAQLAALMRAG